jgi:hypothetical protein
VSEPMGSDPFLGLPGLDRAEALAVAAEQSGRPASILSLLSLSPGGELIQSLH